MPENDDISLFPVDLGSTASNNEFFCPDQTPPYVFYCTIHGNDLFWIFNNQTVTAYLPHDLVGRLTSLALDEYNVTAILAHVTKRIEYNNIPVCVSVLVVEFLNKSQSESVTPFTVSCHTHCQNNGSEVCEEKHYQVAGILYAEYF